jgi:SAM-dependent methyltransferase
VYRNPVERPQDLRSTYADAPVDHATLDALHATQTRTYHVQASRLAGLLERRGAGLEVGSYVGAFLAAARAQGWNFEGLDVNAAVNAYARSKGFVVHEGDLESFTSTGRTFDAIAIWNTFDQLPDPRATLRASRRLLREGGILAVRVPNGACYARWRPRLGGASPRSTLATALLAYNNLLTFPYRFGFTPDSLTRLLRDVGFEVLKVVPDVLVPTADEWTRRWAALEERLFKRLTRRWVPWFEIYAQSGKD